MKAVILAGGKGARLAPYTKILPKPLMPIGDMPILEILLRQIARHGVDEAFLAVGHLAQLLWTFFQDGADFGLRLHYSLEHEPLGTAGPLDLIRDELDDTFLVLNGDILTTLDFTALVAAHHEAGSIATIATFQRQVPIDYGVLEINENNQVTDYFEKPTYRLPVSMGIYVFAPRVLEFIPPGQYLDFPDLVRRLIDAGECVSVCPFDGYWQDLGRSSDYEQAVDDFDAVKATILGSSDPYRERPVFRRTDTAPQPLAVSKPR
jgi:NDP-sugar pyrophosphorylase family protein